MFDNFGQAATGWRHNHGSLTPLVFGFSVMPHQVPSSQRAMSKKVCGRCIGAWRQFWRRFLADPLTDSPYLLPAAALPAAAGAGWRHATMHCSCVARSVDCHQRRATQYHHRTDI
jgi:hypothetical protein